jgi:uncharacterized protein (DUF983 family)
MSLPTYAAGTPQGAGKAAPIEELSLSRAVRLYRRAFLLRCPNCGKGGLLQSWLKLKPRCPGCSLRTDRGEEDFFLGGMMWNIVMAEGALLILTLIFGIITWPDVPWNLLRWGGTVLMLIVPFLFYPLSLVIWLASDILIRPITAEEMEWHRTHRDDEFRNYRDR